MDRLRAVILKTNGMVTFRLQVILKVLEFKSKRSSKYEVDGGLTLRIGIYLTQICQPVNGSIYRYNIG